MLQDPPTQKAIILTLRPYRIKALLSQDEFTKFHHSRDQVQCSNQNTYIFKNNWKNNITQKREREILFPENHIFSPSLSLSGICAKTERFSDGYVRTQLFWTGFHCHCCNNLTAQQCGCNSPSLGFQGRCIHSPPYMRWGKVPVPSPRRKFLCNPPCSTQVSSLWVLLWN